MTSLQKMADAAQVGVAVGSGGTEYLAEFRFDGENSRLTLHSKPEDAYIDVDHDLIQVRMTDGTWATFLSSITTLQQNFSETGSQTLELLPSFVAVGRAALGAGEPLRSIEFSIDDAGTIFYDLDAFSIMVSAEDKLKEIIANQAECVDRSIAVGDHPIGAFFTGKFEILAENTALGKVSVRHQPGYNMGSPAKGVAIRNRIRVAIEFGEPVNLRMAIDRMMPLLRFLQVMGGRTQNVSDIVVQLAKESEYPLLFDVLWCMSWKRLHEEDKPHPADVPVNGGREPEAFAAVMTRWLEQEAERHDARVRFAYAFEQGRDYTVDRLVSAANMFDIWPSCCFTAPQSMGAEVVEARDKAKALFKALPQSDIRDRALGDLGRLGQLNLKAKVLQRAKILLDAAPAKYLDLDLILRTAIDARNHYVHGTPASEARIQFYYGMMAFHVDALEFVFAATDLLDAGWDYGRWASRGTTMSHPFGEFRASYELRRTDYMAKYAALSTAQPDQG